MKIKNGKITIAIIVMFAIALSIVGFTYAYFIAQVQGNTNIESVKVQAGILEVNYISGNNIVAQSLVPEWESDANHYYDPVYSVTSDSGTLKVRATTLTQHPTMSNCKVDDLHDCVPTAANGLVGPATFSITTSQRNTGNVQYIVLLQNISNGIAEDDQTNFQWELYESQSSGAITGGNKISYGVLAASGSQVISPVQLINRTGANHYYLNMKYVDSGGNQNHSFGATVRASIKIMGVVLKDGNYIDENGNIITPWYDPLVGPPSISSTTTPYVVKHMKQKLNSEEYEIADTQNLSGTVGTKITPAVNSYTGFDSPQSQQSTIKEDGSSLIVYYYDRKEFAFSISDRTYVDNTSTANGVYQYGTPITIKSAERTGYQFKWSDNETAYERSFELSGAMSLSPIYTPNTYTLTANAGGGTIKSTTGWTGTGNSATKEITYDGTYGTLPTITREGYTFTGWNTKEDGTGVNITSSTKVSTLTNQNIYAQWNINQYNLNVNSSVNGTKSTTGHTGFTYDVYINNSLVANDVITYSNTLDYNTSVRVVLNSKTNYTTVEDTIEKTITSDTEIIPAWVTSSNIGIQFTYGNTKLIVITEGRTWEAAETYAQSLGGHLAMIKTEAMQNYVYNTILANPTVSNLTTFWIGATDKAKEGEWRWVDGTLLSSTYTNWNSGEPNDSGGEDYCQYYISGSTKGKWNDLNGTQTYPFVVQIGG